MEAEDAEDPLGQQDITQAQGRTPRGDGNTIYKSPNPPAHGVPGMHPAWGTKISESWLPPRLSSWARDGEERQDLQGGSPGRHWEFVVQWLPSPFCFAELYKVTLACDSIRESSSLPPPPPPTPESPWLQLEMRWKSCWAWGEADTNHPHPILRDPRVTFSPPPRVVLHSICVPQEGGWR